MGAGMRPPRAIKASALSGWIGMTGASPSEKIARNIERDTIACAKLHQLGWHTVVIWECQLKPHERDNTLSHLEYILSTTYLNDRRTNRPKPYATPEEQQIYMAAEEMP